MDTAEAGELAIDLARLNFGFDLIDGQVPEDREDLGDRGKRLGESRDMLQKFVEAKGKDGNLTTILKLFLGM